MKSIVSCLFILLCIHSGCNQKTNSKNKTLDFLGEWHLDEASSSYINRGCFSLDYEGSIAKFEITKHKTNYLIRINNSTNTSWQSALSKKNISGSQIINTSDIGKFCGEQTKVRLILRLDPKSSNRILGMFKTTCNPCPDIDFVASRITKTK
ncbi:MAG: hypothetical protein Q8O62_02915 [Aequorivita sp.]|nr:hypothetical protein [Aequorivita sp.]